MDGIPSQQLEPQAEIVKKSFLKTTLGKISIILGVVIIVLAFLASLNYFRVIALPKKLSFLPKKAAYTNTKESSPQARNEPIILNPIPLLSKNIPQILKTPLLPDSWTKISIKQDKTIKDNFILSWNGKEGTVSGVMTVPPDRTGISSLYLSFLDQKISTASAEIASKIASDFFLISPKGKWACKPIYNSIYCENFWEEDNVRRGVGIQSPDKVISFCEHRPDSDLYSWKSCTTEFVNSGVK